VEFEGVLFILSIAPSHRFRSGFIGFLMRILLSVPFNASAISCIANGLADVLAPIQRMSTLALMAFSTWVLFATSVVVSIPVSSLTFVSHFSPISPTPSNDPGRVLGFQIPALKILIPILFRLCAVFSTCSSFSALHGPEIMMGFCVSGSPQFFNCSIFIVLYC